MNGKLVDRALIFIGIIGALNITGIVVLNFFQRPIDDVLKQSLGMCILGIVSLLKTSSDAVGPVETRVTNTAAEPIPTTEAKKK